MEKVFVNPWSGLKDIPRNVWLLSFATLINRSGTMVMPFLVIYMNKEIGVSQSSAGLVLMVYGFGSLLTSPFVGKLSDKIGSLRVMKTSLIVTGLLLVFYSVLKDYYLILLLTLVWSVISEAFRPANMSLISFETSVEQRKTAFALNRLAINLGMSIGPVIGGFLSQVDYSLLFYFNAVSSILAGIFLMVVHFDKREAKPEEIEILESDQSKISRNPFASLTLFTDKKLIYFLIALTPVSLVFFQFLGGLPLYIVGNLNYSESTFGMLMAINTVLIIFIEVPLNNAMAHWDDRKALAFASILTAVGFGAMAISSNLVFLIATIVIWTFGEMIFFPAASSYTALISPDSKRGEYMGYYQMTFSFSMMFGPWIGAVVIDNLGATFLWSGTFFVALISFAMFYSMNKKK